MTGIDTGQIWATIPEFPDYQVSNLGLVYSDHMKRVLHASPNNYGDYRVMLVNHVGRFTRSVVRLVAEAFVPVPDRLCDSVIQLDGVKSNLYAENLAWRPSGFAWEYTRQLRAPKLLHFTNLAVINQMTGVQYPNIVTAAMVEGLLFKDIWRSTHSRTPCYPGNCTFEVIERV